MTPAPRLPGSAGAALAPELDTFPKLLLHHASQRGARPAIREKRRGIWRTLTWRELADQAAALAAALAARGLQRGAHFALVADNRPHLYAAMCAAQWLGAVAVPLYPDSTRDELAAPLQAAQATHVFAENQQQVDKLLEILPACPTIRCIVYDDDRGMRHYQQPELVSYATLLQEGRERAAANRERLDAEVRRGAGGDVAFLFFTAGTTGPAKGVVFTQDALIDRARVAAAAAGLTDRDVAMAYLPPGWLGQTMFSFGQPMVAGCCVCCPESSDTLVADMREMGPTYLLAPPRVLEALVTQVILRIEDAGWIGRALYRRAMSVARRLGPRILAGDPVSVGDRLAYRLYDLLIYGPLRDILGLSRVRAAYTAGDLVAPDLLMFFRALGVNLKQLYGSTETGFLVALQPNGEVRPDTVGRPAHGVELTFSPEREILVRSPGLFREYHRDPDTTRRVMSAEGWYRTGDVGYLGDDGHLRIIDHVQSVGTLSDGTPYAPKGLESKLKVLPYIREAVAFGHGRERVCVLIDIDTAVVGRWADRRGLSYTGHPDLAARDEVYGLIAGCLAEVNTELAREPQNARCQIHRFLILREALDPDDGVLTRTGRLRRETIAERYRQAVEAMYAGRAAAADVRIHDVRIVSPA
jgi:long-chain acyl-CoA synthetase